MVPKVARLQFHSMAYTWKNEHKGKYSIIEGSNRYTGRQQGCSDAQERIMDKENNSRDNNVKEKQDNGKFRSIRENMKK